MHPGFGKGGDATEICAHKLYTMKSFYYIALPLLLLASVAATVILKGTVRPSRQIVLVSTLGEKSFSRTLPVTKTEQFRKQYEILHKKQVRPLLN